MPTPADDCVVLFYRGQRHWVGNVTSADLVPLLGHKLQQLVSALERGAAHEIADSLMGGVEK